MRIDREVFKPEEYQVDKLDLGELMKALDELERLNKKHARLTSLTVMIVSGALGASLMALILALTGILG